MKDIISAILACALANGSDVNLIDSIKEDYREAFIKGEFNKAIIEDLENLNVKGLNNFLEDVLDGDYSIEDKIKAIEQWDNIMVNFVNYVTEQRDRTKESYNKLLTEYEASKDPVYSVFYCPETNLIFFDRNYKLKNSFHGNSESIYQGFNKKEARRMCEEFLNKNPKFYCVDYERLYSK